MVRVRRRRRRRRGTLVLLLHAPGPLPRGGNPLHQHRIFLLPSLLLLLMLFLLVEGSHARPAPPAPRPATRQTPVAGPPFGVAPTEGFDPGEGRENEVMPPDLPWERTQPSGSSEPRQEGPRGTAEGASGGDQISVIEDGNDTLPIPLYGIMTDEISSDVDLMLGGEDGVVTSEELVMWRLTNHDRRKGELETDEELLSRNRRTPRERKGGRKEDGGKKKKKKDEEEEKRGSQRRRKGMKRPRWRERRRKAKEARENRERLGRRGGRNKKVKESNQRPIRRRHQRRQSSVRERFLELTDASKKTRRPRGGGAMPKKPLASRPRAKSPRARGPGSIPREGVTSAEGGVSSGFGNLEDGAARSERSANLSHITGTARKIQMVVKNRNLQIDPWGRVSGAEDEDSDYTILQRTSVSTGRLKIQGVATCLFLCMDRCGLLYGSKNFTEECVWNETMDGHVYNVYTSVAYSNEDRALYLALNGAGKPRRVQIQNKDGKGLVLGKLSTYARVLTRTIPPKRLQRLEDNLLRDRQREAVARAIIAAGGSVPGYSNITSGSLRLRVGPAGTGQAANRSADLVSILTSLGLDPDTAIPDFNLDSVTFVDHPLRHHGYHQLCPMPRPDMVTSGSELVGKNGKVLCKKKDPPVGKKGPGGGGGGDKKKKKKDDEKDGKMRRKRKNQAKDGEEKKKKKKTNNGVGRNNNGGKNGGGKNGGKRPGSGAGGGGGGGGGGGRNGGTKVKKVGEKKMSKAKGNKEKGGERKADLKTAGKNEGRRGRNGEVQKKKKKTQAAKERERKREQERRRRIRKRPCNVGKRPRKDKGCDNEQGRRKRHRRYKEEMHQEQVLHNNTLEEKNKVIEEEEEEVTEAPLEWEEEEEEVEEEERVSEEVDGGESTEGNEEEDGEDVEGMVDEEDDDEEEEVEQEDDEEDGDEEEEEEDEEERIDDGEVDEEGDGEDDGEEEELEEEEEDGGENDGRGINVRRKRTREADEREYSESS